MTTPGVPTVYERTAWQTAPAGLMRPGGTALTDRAIELMALPLRSRVWDIGCGLGVTVERLVLEHGLDAEGVDRSPELIRAARERAHWLRLHCAPGNQLPCPTGRLDAVLLECSWSAMGGCADTQDRDPVLAECHRVLRPGGVIAIADLYARAAPRALADRAAPLGDACWSSMPDEASIRDALARHGFDVEVWEDHTAALREFAARMILEHGSLAPLLGEGATHPEARSALAASRPGYFLLVARRDRMHG